jgi:hypothetical protein
MKTLGTRPPRRYSIRYCACGAQASYAVQVLARTIGPGQSKENRQIRLGSTADLCSRCALDAKAFVNQLGDSGFDALGQISSGARKQRIRKEALNPGLPLF